jgi:hypothetical protein
VTVQDTTAPVLSIPADATVEANGDTSPAATGTATATDLFLGSVTYADTIVSGNIAAGVVSVISRDWVATDSSGNTAAATQTITVVDTTPPVVTAPANVTVEATGPTTAVSLGTATASDIVDGVLTATPDQTGPFAPGTYTITWSATDAAGNTGTATQTVTVTDMTAPSITVPADVTVEANAVSSTVNIGTATAVDLVDGAVAVTNDAPATFPLGTTVVTYTATDAHGNTATATQNVTVVDTTAPVVTATLVPVSLEEDEGSFRVVFSATDLVDANPAITATLNGATVTNGQVVKLERDDEAKVEFERGKLEIKGMSFSLDVSATDASGNTGTAAAAYAFPAEHEKHEARKDKSSHDKKGKKEKKHKKHDKND